MCYHTPIYPTKTSKTMSDLSSNTADLTLDVIIPCYNASRTIRQAVLSALAQPCVRFVYLIDDGSQDDTWQILQSLKSEFDDKIRLEKRHDNGGAAQACNIGAMLSNADIVAFLDADDTYDAGVLEVAKMAFVGVPTIGLVRLRLNPVGFPDKYTAHPNFARAWQQLAMTVAGNTVFRRHVFLACGGFPCDELFRRLGGEDGALGLALVANTVVGILFDERVPAVNHYYRLGIHGERLLNVLLYGISPMGVEQADFEYANQVTNTIGKQLKSIQTILNVKQTGVMPLQIQFG